MRERIQWVIVAALLVWIFYPTFVWMAERWLAKDSYFGHGFIIPLVSLYWVVKKKNQMVKCEKKADYRGVFLVLLAALVQVAASIFRVYFLSAFSFVVLLLGGAWFLFGKNVLRYLWFPILFLFLMVPLPLLLISQATIHLKFMVTELSVFILQTVGIEAVRMGSYIQMPHEVVLVGDPCSGLRSFLAFLCLGIIFAYGDNLSMWRRVVLVLMGLPLAIISNVLRVFLLAFLSEIYGSEWVTKWIHDPSGYVVFLIAFFVLITIRKKLEIANVCPA